MHDPEYITRVDECCVRGDRVIDSMDTAICPISAGVARLAAGSAVDALSRLPSASPGKNPIFVASTQSTQKRQPARSRSSSRNETMR